MAMVRDGDGDGDGTGDGEGDGNYDDGGACDLCHMCPRTCVSFAAGAMAMNSLVLRSSILAFFVDSSSSGVTALRSGTGIFNRSI